MKRPKILISNDDGIFSPGIYALWEAMCEIGDPIVVAPDTERSAVGHAITLIDPLRVTSINRSGGFKGFAVSGTPADCAKIAIKSILNEKPDLMISGINAGSNIGKNLIYSGTVSAATEGTMLGIPSIAISLNSFSFGDYRASKQAAKDIANNVLSEGIPTGTLLNVNIPFCEPSKIKGIKITRQGSQYFKDQFEKREDPRRRIYYWMKGDMIQTDRELIYDGKALQENYISITPIQFDMTDESCLGELRTRFKDE